MRRCWTFIIAAKKSQQHHRTAVSSYGLCLESDRSQDPRPRSPPQPQSQPQAGDLAFDEFSPRSALDAFLSLFTLTVASTTVDMMLFCRPHCRLNLFWILAPCPLLRSLCSCPRPSLITSLPAVHPPKSTFRKNDKPNMTTPQNWLHVLSSTPWTPLGVVRTLVLESLH